ncbi:MAG: glycosyltransferase [Prevotellaceae bacterium]|nr:glycosyltransferase [Prevotellaceae bacterium]
MISIIVAIYNQIEMNKLFLHSLRKYTHNPYELIVVDNNSTDGSREFFENNGAIVIQNNGNYSYPYCQNQGIRKASYDVLCFLNNDNILSPDWDVHLLNVIGKNNCDVVSFASNDRGINRHETKTKDQKWKRIKYPITTMFGNSKFSLRLMFKLMYPKWEKYTKKILDAYGYQLSEGFSGSAIAMTMKGIEKVGLWDERLQGADFDLYARTKQRHEQVGDIQPLSIIAGLYIHHYGRITMKSKHRPPQFVDVKNLISWQDKWGMDACEKFMIALKQ